MEGIELTYDKEFQVGWNISIQNSITWPQV